MPYSVRVADEPGMLFGLTKVLAECQANVTHVDLHLHESKADVYFEFTLDEPSAPVPIQRLKEMSGVDAVEVTTPLARIYGKRVIVMGGGAQVGQVALGAISEADRHNIRGERISIDTIPLVGERELASAVRAVVRLPRVKLLVLAGSLMGGEISRAVEDVTEQGTFGYLPEHGRQRAGCCRPRCQRSRSGRCHGRDGGSGDREIQPAPAAETAILSETVGRRSGGFASTLTRSQRVKALSIAMLGYPLVAGLGRTLSWTVDGMEPLRRPRAKRAAPHTGSMAWPDRCRRRCSGEIGASWR